MAEDRPRGTGGAQRDKGRRIAARGAADTMPGMRRRAPISAPLLALALSACGTTPTADPAAEADYVFVFLEAGERTEVAPGDLQFGMAARAAHVARLADEGELLLEGAFAPPRARPTLRAMEIFATDDLAHALELAEADPAVRSELMKPIALPWRGPAALRTIPTLDRELRATLSPDAPPDALVRPYVLVTADDAEAADRALEPLRAAGHVAFFGRFGGARAGQALFALVSRDEKSAAALLEMAGPEAPAWTLHPWYGPSVLERFARPQ
jgi:uncharacterized protein YciI